MRRCYMPVENREGKLLHVLSWGGGTQSTALMLKMLEDGERLDYIIFADTNNEPEMVYKQVYKIQKYVKETYKKEIIITKKNKELIPDNEVVKRIKEGKIKKYRSSDYADLFQSHVLYFQGELNAIDSMPFWMRHDNGKVGKTPFKACTGEYKIRQIMMELRKQESVKQFYKELDKIYMYIGFSNDEIQRSKAGILPYVQNTFPLIDKYNWSKQDCIDYVNKLLGFEPISSVCNMCYANSVDRVYSIFKNDKPSWDRLLVLDKAMDESLGKTKFTKGKPFMFHWAAEENVRIYKLDFEEFYKGYKDKQKTRNLFDLESELSCMGGCFV